MLSFMMRIITAFFVPALDFILTVNSSTFRCYREPMDYNCSLWPTCPTPTNHASCPFSVPRSVVSQHYSIIKSISNFLLLLLFLEIVFPSFLGSNKCFSKNWPSYASKLLWTLKSIVTNDFWLGPIIYATCWIVCLSFSPSLKFQRNFLKEISLYF